MEVLREGEKGEKEKRKNVKVSVAKKGEIRGGNKKD